MSIAKQAFDSLIALSAIPVIWGYLKLLVLCLNPKLDFIFVNGILIPDREWNEQKVPHSFDSEKIAVFKR